MSFLDLNRMKTQHEAIAEATRECAENALWHNDKITTHIKRNGTTIEIFCPKCTIECKRETWHKIGGLLHEGDKEGTREQKEIKH